VYVSLVTWSFLCDIVYILFLFDSLEIDYILYTQCIYHIYTGFWFWCLFLIFSVQWLFILRYINCGIIKNPRLYVIHISIYYAIKLNVRTSEKILLLRNARSMYCTAEALRLTKFHPHKISNDIQCFHEKSFNQSTPDFLQYKNNFERGIWVIISSQLQNSFHV